MNILENITKFTNLSSNDSLSSFKNFAAQQSHYSYQVFYDFLIDVKPKRVLEIGTALGGFTSFLKFCVDQLNLDTKILSYEIHYQPWYEHMIKQGIDVRIENVFDFDTFEVKQEVIDFIQQDGVTIVLCDGGWKKGEFNILSEYIKTGDFILAHDYAENREIFEEKIKDKIWNWHEIQDSDIRESVDKHNLDYYEKDKFEGAAWTCRIKK